MNVEGFSERPVFFPTEVGDLAGVLTVPTSANGIGVLIPWGSSTAPSSGINQVRAVLARELARAGFHAFRFDYPGVGESIGEYRRPEMATPFTAEVLGAAAWLGTQGLHRLAIVANCFGGWSSLMAAPRLDGLEGLFLVNPPVRRDHKEVRAAEEGLGWWLKNAKRFRIAKLRSSEYRAKYRKMLNAKRASLTGDRRDQRFRRAVTHLIDRKVPLFIIYGDDDFRGDFEWEMANGLSELIDAAGPPTRVVLVPERLAGFRDTAAHAMLLDEVLPWLVGLGDRRPEAVRLPQET